MDNAAMSSVAFYCLMIRSSMSVLLRIHQELIQESSNLLGQ